MLWGERVGRRRALIAVLALFALADIAFAVVVMRGGSGGTAQAALPMHPVVGSFVPDETQARRVLPTPGCFQQAFGNIAYREGPKAALSLVDRVYGNGADPACHRVTHIIGAASLARFGGNVARGRSRRATRPAGPATTTGFSSGSRESAKSRKPSALAAVARTLCTDRRHDAVDRRTGCRPRARPRADDRDGSQSARSRSRSARGSARWWDARRVSRAASSWRTSRRRTGSTRSFLRDDDPIYPCNWVAVGERRRCYQIVTLADPPSRRRRLGAHGRDLRRRGARLRRLVLPLASDAMPRVAARATRRRSRSSAR